MVRTQIHVKSLFINNKNICKSFHFVSVQNHLLAVDLGSSKLYVLLFFIRKNVSESVLYSVKR